MRRFGRLVVLLAFAAALLSGCGGALPPPAAPPQPTRAAAPVKGKPVLCSPKGGGEIFVVALPELPTP